MTDRPVIDAAVHAVAVVSSRKEACDFAFGDFMTIVHLAEHDIHVAIAGRIARSKLDEIAPLRCAAADVRLIVYRPSLPVLRRGSDVPRRSPVRGRRNAEAVGADKAAEALEEEAWAWADEVSELRATAKPRQNSRLQALGKPSRMLPPTA